MRTMRIAALAAALTLAHTATAAAGGGGGGGDQDQLRSYAQHTWASFDAMTDARSGLPADILNADGTTSVQTSTTNIGAYMWSAVVAQQLGFISQRELSARMTRTITTLERMERVRRASSTTGTTTARAPS